MTVLSNILAVIAGLVLGAATNMGLILLGSAVIPPPPGVDMTDMDAVARSMHRFDARHFAFPFLAHATGTLVGVLTGFLAAATRRFVVAHAIGVMFLLGGIAASVMIPAPTWFIVSDLLLAYLPMAWLATKIATRIRA